jgi:hypothetical protein
VDQRGRQDRKVVAIECHVEGVSADTPLRLSDIGLGGGFVTGHAQVQRGDRVIVTFSLDGRELRCAARIAHVQPSRGFGFAFFQEELTPQVTVALQRFLDTGAHDDF